MYVDVYTRDDLWSVNFHEVLGREVITKQPTDSCFHSKYRLIRRGLETMTE